MVNVRSAWMEFAALALAAVSTFGAVQGPAAADVSFTTDRLSERIRIVPRDGSLRYGESDIEMNATGLALALRRCYCSSNATEGLFGRGWACLFDRRIKLATNNQQPATVHDEWGEALVFSPRGSSLLYSNSGRSQWLMVEPDRTFLRDHRERFWSFRKDGRYFYPDHYRPALTRYGSALASELKIHIRTKARVVEVSGPIVLLPKTSLSTDEAISRVLSDFCGVETEVPEPDWIEEMEAPGQKAIDDGIDRTQTEIRKLNGKLAGLHEKRSEVRSCLKLLYARGETLEKVARQICRELGVEVEEPTEPGKEDGWITFQHEGDVFEGVLEVKSTKSDQFGEDGIRQLLDWIGRGVRLRKKRYKGIFIGTNAVEKRLEDRPYAFAKDWRESAELAEICALKTEDLFRAYLLRTEGKLNTAEFWSKVFSTNGIFDSKFLGDL